MKLRTRNTIWIMIYASSLAISASLLVFKISELLLENESLKSAQLELHRQKSLAQELCTEELSGAIEDASQDSGDSMHLKSLLSKRPVSREKLMTKVKNITRHLNIENPVITLSPASSTRLPNDEMIDIQPLDIEFVAPSDVCGYDLVEFFLHQFEAVVVPRTLRLENISETDGMHKIRHQIGFYLLNFSKHSGLE